MAGLFACPESPVWLLWTGQAEAARVAASKLTGEAPQDPEARSLLPSETTHEGSAQVALQLQAHMLLRSRVLILLYDLHLRGLHRAYRLACHWGALSGGMCRDLQACYASQAVLSP